MVLPELKLYKAGGTARYKMSRSTFDGKAQTARATTQTLAQLASQAPLGMNYGAGDMVNQRIDQQLAITHQPTRRHSHQSENSEEPEETISTWPSGKGGTKPNLLQHLEHYLHEQLTTLHHSQGLDQETLSVMRAEIAKYVISCFAKHFRTYREVFQTVYDTVDGILYLFEHHREQIFQLRNEADQREAKFDERIAEKVKLEEELRAEIASLQDVAERFGPLEEDRKVLRAQSEDFQRQISRQRQHLDSLNERLEQLSRQHVTHTIKEDRLKVKLEQAEKDCSELSKQVQELTKGRSEAIIRMEAAEVDLEKAHTEVEQVNIKCAKLEKEKSQLAEDIKMLRFDRKRLLNQLNSRPGMGGRQETTMFSDEELNLMNTMNQFGSPRAGDGRPQTPRPDWKAIDEELSAVDIEEHAEGTDTESNTGTASVASGSTNPADLSKSPAGSQRQSLQPAAVLSPQDFIAKEKENTSTSDRVSKMAAAFSKVKAETLQLRQHTRALELELDVIRTVKNTAQQPADMEGAPASPLSPTGHGGKKSKALQALEEKIFVPCGTGSDVPKYLRVPETNFNIKLKPMTLATLLDHLDDAQTWIGQKYLKIDPEDLECPGAMQEYIDKLNAASAYDPDAIPVSFAEGYYQWLLAVHPAPPSQQQALNTSNAPSSPLGGTKTSGDGDEEEEPQFSLEMAYTLVFLAQHTYGTNVHCKLFLYQLSGEIPMTSFLHLRLHLRKVRNVFEACDLNGTNSIWVPNAILALKRDLKYLSDYDCKVLTEAAQPPPPPKKPAQPALKGTLLRRPQGKPVVAGNALGGKVTFTSPTKETTVPNFESEAPTKLPAVPFLPLLRRDHLFVQSFTNFFLSSILYNFQCLTRSLKDLPFTADELPLQLITQAIQSADSQINPDVVRNFIGTCMRLDPKNFSGKTRVRVSLILVRMKEVFLRRSTPMNVGLFNLDSVEPPALAQVQVQPSLQSIKEPQAPSGAPQPPAGVASGKRVAAVTKGRK